MSGIPFIRVSGDAHSRGVALGSRFKDRIQKTVNFYEQTMFKSSPLCASEIQQLAKQVKVLIKQFNPNYCVEIEAMAEASEVQAWQLYALNARTEILNAPVTECTSLAFKDSRLLGQTWDWIQELEDLVVLVEHEYPDGRHLLTLTEPGMLAKIGMNDQGLGLCINILMSTHELDGVPVHILARAILESKNVADAYHVIKNSNMGKSSHFLLADKNGDTLSMEFADGKRAEVQIKDNAYAHTNHCLAQHINSEAIPTSAERLHQSRQYLETIDNYTLTEMKQILLDDSAGTESIHSCYHSEPLLGGLQVGTCATVMMDLSKRTFYLKKGPDKNTSFASYRI